MVVGASTTAIVSDSDTALLTLGDGSVQATGMTGDPVRGAPDHRGPVIGGHDGRVIRFGGSGDTAVIEDFGNKGVEQLVVGPMSKLIVAGVGKDAIVWLPGAQAPSHRFASPSGRRPVARCRGHAAGGCLVFRRGGLCRFDTDAASVQPWR